MKRICLIVSLLIASPLAAQELVKNETIALQKKLTVKSKLSNGIPVVYRQIEKSDIMQLDVSFAWGIADQKKADQVVPGVMFDTMTFAAKGWPKSKVFATTEKYSAAVDCGSGIEMSNCALSTVNDFWGQLLPLFSAIVKAPTFTESDLKLVLNRQEAQRKNEVNRPEILVNEVVNRVFYAPSHPYFLSSGEALKQLATIKRKNLVDLHKTVLNANLMQITVIGSLPWDQVKADLEKSFGSITGKKVERLAPPTPAYDHANAFAFEDKNNPTAYLNVKMNAPGMTDKEAVATDLLFKILSEELENEVRTKRSLSYAVYAHDIRHALGIGVISASTSKPKETLDAIQSVIDQMKKKRYTDEELKQFKTSYATSYFLTLEEHSSLAGSLAKYNMYFKNTDALYDMPRQLEKITPKNIQDLANKYLVNFRMGVVYGKDKFDTKWAKAFIDKNKKGS